jgi:hypothetical protein
MRHASKVDRIIDETPRKLRRKGFKPGLTRESYRWIVRDGGFNRATYAVAFVLAELALRCHPINVRGLMYQGQVAGWFPSTGDKYKVQTERVMLKLRRAGLVPYDWIVDSTRHRRKPSSWSGLSDFADDVARGYRRNFWRDQPDYVEVFIEKEGRAGIIEPVTDEFDIYLTGIRGQISETKAWEIGEQWKQIDKPIYVYYLGDHDPAGLSIEACLKSKLRHFAGKDFHWQRLAITPFDLANTKLIGFPVKRKSDKGKSLPESVWKPYIDQYGDRCVELDALDPEETRRRVRDAIEQHIDQYEWDAMQRTEKLERETLKETLVKFA